MRYEVRGEVGEGGGGKAGECRPGLTGTRLRYRVELEIDVVDANNPGHYANLNPEVGLG